MTDREEFEALKLSFGRNMVLATDGEYQSVETRKLLEVWQAARAQPAEQAYLQVIDNELVCAHLDVANATDTFDEAKAKVSKLIAWHVDVATDPAVNGGYELVKVQPAEQEPAGEVQHLHELNDPWLSKLPIGAKLYTHPQPKLEPLSDEQAHNNAVAPHAAAEIGKELK